MSLLLRDSLLFFFFLSLALLCLFLAFRGPGGGLLDRGSAGGPPPRSGSGYRLVVSNLATRTSWQDLKDFARSAGNVRFTDVWNERGKKYGIIEYTSRSDYEYALKVRLTGL